MNAYRERQRGGSADGRSRNLRIFLEHFDNKVASLLPGEPVPSFDFDGTDATGTVRCVVDLSGHVTRVLIDDEWWNALGPGRVAGAVLEAMRSAKIKAEVAPWALLRHGHRVDAANPILATIFAELPEPLPPSGADDLPAVLARKLDRATAVLDKARRLRQIRDSSERRVVSGPRGMFRVILSGLNIVGAEVNEYAVNPTDAAELAEDAHAALLAAAPATYLANLLTREDR